MKEKNLIFIPICIKEGFDTGINISRKQECSNIYFKNAVVSLVSAKHHNPNDEVALVTNVANISASFLNILEKNGILVFTVPFDNFIFDKNFKWSLCFYKLCALSHVVKEHSYKNYCYLDADTYIQNEFSFIWDECSENILLYDINHGLQVKDYKNFISEVNSFDCNKKLITQYGGEFFAASKQNAELFVNELVSVYEKAKNFSFSFGDEFIIGLAASNMKSMIKNASPYIYRYWTKSFRLVSTNYKFNKVSILHCPDEKEDGFIKIYKFLKKHGDIPNEQKAHRYLHVSCYSLEYIASRFLKK